MKKGIFAFGLVLTVLALCSVSQAQVAPAATGGTTIVSASGSAVALKYQSNWSAATLLPQSFDIFDYGAQKGNSVSVETVEFLAPGPGFNSYLFGTRLDFDISGLISGSNLSGDQFRPFVRAAGGETTIGSATKPTALVGGGVAYMITPNLTWTTIEGYCLWFNGSCSPAISDGIQYHINGQNSQAAAVKRMLHRAALKAAAVRR